MSIPIVGVFYWKNRSRIFKRSNRIVISNGQRSKELLIERKIPFSFPISESKEYFLK
jgi:hypothetical protein